MAFIPLPFGIKVEVSWTTGSGIAVCVFFNQKTVSTPVTTTDLTNAISLYDAWRTAIRPIQSTQVGVAGIRATDWSVPEGASQFTAPSANVFGTNTLPSLPMNVAMCASHYTGFIGRSRRGRSYIPGLGENVVAVGDILGALFRNYAVTAFAALRASSLAASQAQVVASFQHNGAPRVTGLGTVVLTTAVDQYSDSQRRRLAGRGA
jgi:hypothetical protein